jgi:hypothetical protein
MIEHILERIAMALEEIQGVLERQERRQTEDKTRGSSAEQGQENMRQVNEAAEKGETLTEPVKTEPKKDKKKKEAPPLAVTTEVTPATDVTVEEIRDALVNLSIAKGKDMALSVLKEVGQADKLSSVDARLYPDLLAACQKKGAENA